MKELVIKYIENNQFLEARQAIDQILLLELPRKTSAYYIVEHAIAFITENYMKTINLTQVAEQIGVSPNYLSKIFVQHTGMNFTAYLNFFRVKQAEILLLKSEMRVVAISEAVGFADASYFIRIFRQYTHSTPTQFRYYYYGHRNEFLKNAH